MSAQGWSADLQERVRCSAPPGSQVRTLSNGKPNWIVDVNDDGVIVHTERSKDAGSPQLVPGWMFVVAWDHLQRHGSLTNKTLLHELNIKRSSAVCAVLAQFPEVTVHSTRPIELCLIA